MFKSKSRGVFVLFVFLPKVSLFFFAEVVKDSEKIYDELKAEEKPQIHIYNGLTATSGYTQGFILEHILNTALY